MLEPLFNKVADLKVCKFIKKRHKQRCFPVNIAKIFRTPMFFRKFLPPGAMKESEKNELNVKLCLAPFTSKFVLQFTVNTRLVELYTTLCKTFAMWHYFHQSFRRKSYRNSYSITQSLALPKNIFVFDTNINCDPRQGSS